MRSACSYSLLYRSIVFSCFLVFAPPPTPSPPAGRGLFTQGAPPPALPLCINFSPPSPRMLGFYARGSAPCTPAFTLNFPHLLPVCGDFYARGSAPCTPALHQRCKGKNIRVRCDNDAHFIIIYPIGYNVKGNCRIYAKIYLIL